MILIVAHSNYPILATQRAVCAKGKDIGLVKRPLSIGQQSLLDTIESDLIDVDKTDLIHNLVKN
jgi:hypothetical protein